MRNPQVLSIDAGGTMTDTFLIDQEGEFTVGKAKTTPDDESEGVLESTEDALGYWEMQLSEGLSTVKSGVYSGTGMLNRLVERKPGSSVGLVVNKGMEDQLRLGRGKQAYLGYSYEDKLHVNTHKHPDPLIPKDQIKGVTERIDEFGEEVIPLYEGEARKAIEDLLERDVDHVVVLFLHSYENPTHEQQFREIAEEVMAEHGEHVPVALSSDHYPRREELPRLNTITADKYAAEPSREQFENIDRETDELGGSFDLRVMGSHGGTIDPDTQELSRTLVSGPIGGIIGGIDIADKLGIENLTCTDIGGTSFDMGVITNTDFAIDYRPNMAQLLLSLPMVEMESVGAGTGSYVRIDPAYERLTLGPDSAGDKVGVCNLDADVTTATVTDCHVAMGIINPDNFLGGRLDIDRDVAIDAVREQVADPLDMDVYNACNMVVDVLETRLSTSLESVMSGTGRPPSKYACLSYGGGGPVHTVGYTESLPFTEVLVPGWAAAFSAFGCGVADYEYRYDRTTSIPVMPDADADDKAAVAERLSETWGDLEERVVDQFEPEYDREEITFHHQFRAQYQGQLESITVDSPVGRVESADDLDRAISAYEQTYAEMYAEQARSPELGHNFTQLIVRGTIDIVKPEIPQEPLQGPDPPESAHEGEREVFLDGNWRDADILRMGEIRAGNEITGPAIIEDPATTFVVPPGYETSLSENRIFSVQEAGDAS